MQDGSRYNILEFFEDEIKFGKLEKYYNDFFKMETYGFGIEDYNYFHSYVDEGYITISKEDPYDQGYYDQKYFFHDNLRQRFKEPQKEFELDYKRQLFAISNIEDRKLFKSQILILIDDLVSELRQINIPKVYLDTVHDEFLVNMTLFVQTYSIDRDLNMARHDRFVWVKNTDLLFILFKVMLDAEVIKAESGINKKDNYIEILKSAFLVPTKQGSKEEYGNATYIQWTKLSSEFYNEKKADIGKSREDYYRRLLKLFKEILDQ